MSSLQARPLRQQRVPLSLSPDAAGIAVQASPLDGMTVMQTAIEGAREQIEETRVLQPMTPEVVYGVMGLVRGDLIDWEALEEAEHEDGGWGG